MKIVVVIPTYNEAENIDLLIASLEEKFKVFPHHEMHILVVDGNSPDKTGDKVLANAKKYSNVYLLLEKNKAGLGAAYIYAFKYAMSELSAEALVQMDADLQHDPEDFIKIIKKFDEGYDYVLGSRYIKGGSIPKEWAFYRRFISIYGSLFAKVVLGIYQISDFTTGFRISKVKGFMDQINLDSINSKGFSYNFDLLCAMVDLGARITEVPITFGLRDRGNSKMEKENLMQSLQTVFRLRYERSKSFFKFIIVGFSGLFVDSSIFNVLRVTLFAPHISNIFSGFIAMITTFLLNNFWSFKEKKFKVDLKMLKIFAFYALSSCVPIFFRTFLIKVAVEKMGNGFLVENGAFFIGILFGLIWNYTVYSRVIWKKT